MITSQFRNLPDFSTAVELSASSFQTLTLPIHTTMSCWLDCAMASWLFLFICFLLQLEWNSYALFVTKSASVLSYLPLFSLTLSSSFRWASSLNMSNPHGSYHITSWPSSTWPLSPVVRYNRQPPDLVLTSSLVKQVHKTVSSCDWFHVLSYVFLLEFSKNTLTEWGWKMWFLEREPKELKIRKQCFP